MAAATARWTNNHTHSTSLLIDQQTHARKAQTPLAITEIKSLSIADITNVATDANPNAPAKIVRRIDDANPIALQAILFSFSLSIL